MSSDNRAIIVCKSYGIVVCDAITTFTGVHYSPWLLPERYPASAKQVCSANSFYMVIVIYSPSIRGIILSNIVRNIIFVTKNKNFYVHAYRRCNQIIVSACLAV